MADSLHLIQITPVKTYPRQTSKNNNVSVCIHIPYCPIGDLNTGEPCCVPTALLVNADTQVESPDCDGSGLASPWEYAVISASSDSLIGQDEELPHYNTLDDLVEDCRELLLASCAESLCEGGANRVMTPPITSSRKQSADQRKPSVEESLVKMNLDVSLSSEKRFIIGLNNNKACDNSEELCSAWIDQHIKLGFMACSVWGSTGPNSLETDPGDDGGYTDCNPQTSNEVNMETHRTDADSVPTDDRHTSREPKSIVSSKQSLYITQLLAKREKTRKKLLSSSGVTSHYSARLKTPQRQRMLSGMLGLGHAETVNKSSQLIGPRKPSPDIQRNIGSKEYPNLRMRSEGSLFTNVVRLNRTASDRLRREGVPVLEQTHERYPW